MAERVNYLSLTYEESLQIKKKERKKKTNNSMKLGEKYNQRVYKNIYIYIANSFETLGGKMLNLN